MNELGTDTLFPPKQVESVAIVSLLHDICKTQSYKMEFKDQKVYSDHGTKFDKRGAYDLESVPFYTVDEKFPFGHGEKSVFLINEHMHLTRDEALAIRFHMATSPTATPAKFIRSVRWRYNSTLPISRQPT